MSMPMPMHGTENVYAVVFPQFENDVFLPTDEPHGSIEASLTRKHSVAVSKL